MTEQGISAETQPGRINKGVLAISIVILLTLASITVYFYFQKQKELKSARMLESAHGFMQQGDCTSAVPLLTQVIAIDPNNVDAYYKRAACYAQMPSNVFEEQQNNFVNALHDLDTLIVLDPTVGDYYAYRENIFRGLAQMANDSSTKFALYELAIDNSEKAMELGVSEKYLFVYRHHARNLIEANHCEDGLKETQDLIDQSKPGDANMDSYNIYLTEAYVCLGNLEKALETAQLIQCDNPATSCRSMLLAQIYFQSGETEKALDLLNYMIDLEPTFGGWRYFIRAMIYYEKGEKELALQDLATGDNYTWYGDGVYWYVKAKMAYDEGDEQNGMLYLQYAESTLDVQYIPLRQKILEELIERGGSPLVISPQIPLATTPIP